MGWEVNNHNYTQEITELKMITWETTDLKII